MTKHILFIAAAILLAVNMQAFARHVTHPVTPANISKQPFAFTVNVKTVGEFQEFEIVVQAKAGGKAPIMSASGEVRVSKSGQQKRELPPVARVESNGVQTYTFRLSPAVVDRATFTFTESDLRAEFPNPGDFWVFRLSEFTGNIRK